MGVEPIRRSVTVRCDPDRAFRVFTEEIDTWWPLETHTRALDDFEGQEVKTERVEFQTFVGGQVLEHMSNGSTLPWGEVIGWDPPNSFVLAWKPNSSERPPTELEVRFSAQGNGTVVELEHRGWERLGDLAEEARSGYAEGWVDTVERFRARADEDA